MWKVRLAFTLIELLLVLVILGVLAAIAVPMFTRQVTPAKERSTVAQISSIKNALATFELDNGRLPTAEEGLEALLTAPADLGTTWKGPYLEQVPADGWGRPFIYRLTGDGRPTYALVSIGADGMEATEDDIDRYTRK